MANQTAGSAKPRLNISGINLSLVRRSNVSIVPLKVRAFLLSYGKSTFTFQNRRKSSAVMAGIDRNMEGVQTLRNSYESKLTSNRENGIRNVEGGHCCADV